MVLQRENKLFNGVLSRFVVLSSMVIRDLTLRSAASFGSFHLIRLLYDEYMFYLVEHRVAQATGETPIGVMGEVQLWHFWFILDLLDLCFGFLILMLFHSHSELSKSTNCEIWRIHWMGNGLCLVNFCKTLERDYLSCSLSHILNIFTKS